MTPCLSQNIIVNGSSHIDATDIYKAVSCFLICVIVDFTSGSKGVKKFLP